jgi:hypothetical protein
VRRRAVLVVPEGEVDRAAAAFMMRPIYFLAACEPALAARSPAFAVRSVVCFTARSLIDANQRGDLFARVEGARTVLSARAIKVTSAMSRAR